jgi:hypothetical protein
MKEVDLGYVAKLGPQHHPRSCLYFATCEEPPEIAENKPVSAGVSNKATLADGKLT